MNRKAIAYSREDKDFTATLDGEYIGSFRSYLAAEEALDALVYEQLARTNEREADALWAEAVALVSSLKDRITSYVSQGKDTGRLEKALERAQSRHQRRWATWNAAINEEFLAVQSVTQKQATIEPAVLVTELEPGVLSLTTTEHWPRAWMVELDGSGQVQDVYDADGVPLLPDYEDEYDRVVDLYQDWLLDQVYAEVEARLIRTEVVEAEALTEEEAAIHAAQENFGFCGCLNKTGIVCAACRQFRELNAYAYGWDLDASSGQRTHIGYSHLMQLCFRKWQDERWVRRPVSARVIAFNTRLVAA